MFSFLKSAFTELTWSERPRRVSPPLQDTEFKRGKHLQRIWLHKELARPPAEKIYLGLGEIDISHIRDRRDWSRVLVFRRAPEVKAEACGDFLRACLGLPAFEDFGRSDFGGRLLRLDLAITDMSPGTTALRLLDWPLLMLGLGRAHLQVEGILSAPSRRQVLLKFIARRWHSGGSARKDEMPAPDNPALPEDFPKTMVGHLIRRVAYDILMELDVRLNTARK